MHWHKSGLLVFVASHCLNSIIYFLAFPSGKGSWDFAITINYPRKIPCFISFRSYKVMSTFVMYRRLVVKEILGRRFSLTSKSWPQRHTDCLWTLDQVLLRKGPSFEEVSDPKTGKNVNQDAIGGMIRHVFDNWNSAEFPVGNKSNALT